MQATARTSRDTTTETDVAVLQVEVNHLREDVSEIKSNVKDLQDSIDTSSKNTMSLLKEMQNSAHASHIELNKKISALEKWRYMMMGAGIMLGYFGFEMVAKLFQAH